MRDEQTPALQPAASGGRGHDVESIKAEIDRTQADLAGTMAELQRRLTVSHLVEQTKNAARGKLRAWGDAARVTSATALVKAQRVALGARARLRHNPAPIVLLGAGLGAALWQGARRRRRDPH